MAYTWFWVFLHCDLDLGDMTLGQDHDKPLGHGQQLCAGSKIGVKIQGPPGPLEKKILGAQQKN